MFSDQHSKVHIMIDIKDNNNNNTNRTGLTVIPA